MKKTFTLIRGIALVIIALCAAGSIRAQTALTINWPKDGSVFQRNSTGTGRIMVLGTFNSKSFSRLNRYTVTATLTPLDVKTGVPTGGTPRSITAQPSPGGFIATALDDVPQGWYELKVRADPAAAYATTLPTKEVKLKVGIGEVFIISGQSNGSGLPNFNGTDNVADFIGKDGSAPLDGVRVQAESTNLAEAGAVANNPYDAAAPFDQYALISNLVSVAENSGASIGASGPSLWFWARLGQKIAYQYNSAYAN